MATAKCGLRWSWGSLMWCNGKEKKGKTDAMCAGCPWFKGNRQDS